MNELMHYISSICITNFVIYNLFMPIFLYINIFIFIYIHYIFPTYNLYFSFLPFIKPKYCLKDFLLWIQNSISTTTKKNNNQGKSFAKEILKSFSLFSMNKYFFKNTRLGTSFYFHSFCFDFYFFFFRQEEEHIFQSLRKMKK